VAPVARLAPRRLPPLQVRHLRVPHPRVPHPPGHRPLLRRRLLLRHLPVHHQRPEPVRAARQAHRPPERPVAVEAAAAVVVPSRRVSRVRLR
jgi:hypothetical protein